MKIRITRELTETHDIYLTFYRADAASADPGTLRVVLATYDHPVADILSAGDLARLETMLDAVVAKIQQDTGGELIQEAGR